MKPTESDGRAAWVCPVSSKVVAQIGHLTARTTPVTERRDAVHYRRQVLAARELPNSGTSVALELTRSRGHLILGKTPEEGAHSGSSAYLSEEFRREACELVRRGDRSQRQVAADLGIPDQTLNNWMKAENRANVRAKDPNALTETELAELKRLRKENADLKTVREILFNAAAFFARETDR
jgi:transposase